MTAQDDRILLPTRLLAAAVVPFLILAFIILYFFPDSTGERFSWAIQPNMTAMFMGAGYLGGAWLFLNTIFGRRWHRVAAGFPAVTTFASAMLVATALHWQVFDLSRLAAALWVGLYVAAPLLVPLAWLRNRPVDSGEHESLDRTMPTAARWGLRLLGVLLAAFALGGFIQPAWLIGLWPWPLSALTARIMSGWFGLLAVGGLVIAAEPRWSGWKVGLQSIGLWQVLVLIAAYVRAEDFHGSALNWYTISVAAVVAAMIGLYVMMELPDQKPNPPQALNQP